MLCVLYAIQSFGCCGAAMSGDGAIESVIQEAPTDWIQSHLIAASDYVSRNANNGLSLGAGGFTTFTWDGKVPFTNATGLVGRKELPAGAYKLQLVVTKALAEENNPAHIETWTSPTINIVRN